MILFDPASTSPIKFFAITEPDENISIPDVETGPTKLPETRVTVTVFVKVSIESAVMFGEVTIVAGMTFAYVTIVPVTVFDTTESDRVTTFEPISLPKRLPPELVRVPDVMTFNPVKDPTRVVAVTLPDVVI
jgi:hypothetical protein